ncbi:MAG: hypothetical protein K6G81_11325 [Lachnospiraceae bacterium]|nr:hypothetical protein [Lachnospiraceae bacterium]
MAQQAENNANNTGNEVFVEDQSAIALLARTDNPENRNVTDDNILPMDIFIEMMTDQGWKSDTPEDRELLESIWDVAQYADDNYVFGIDKPPAPGVEFDAFLREVLEKGLNGYPQHISKHSVRTLQKALRDNEPAYTREINERGKQGYCRSVLYDA